MEHNSRHRGSDCLTERELDVCGQKLMNLGFIEYTEYAYKKI